MHSVRHTEPPQLHSVRRRFRAVHSLFRQITSWACPCRVARVGAILLSRKVQSRCAPRSPPPAQQKPSPLSVAVRPPTAIHGWLLETEDSSAETSPAAGSGFWRLPLGLWAAFLADSRGPSSKKKSTAPAVPYWNPKREKVRFGLLLPFIRRPSPPGEANGADG